jgi:hypothetical protein
VVLYHADTDAKANPESRKAHAWITELRVGSMERKGAKVATLEGRFSWVNEATQADVKSGALAFGSVTIVQDAIDEESGEDVGTLLYSFSLTNNPALVDLPRLAASRATGEREELGYYYGDLDSREDLIACLRAVFELPVTSAEADVLAELEKLGPLCASGDEGACEAVATLRRMLRLPLLTSAQDVLAEVRKGLDSLPSEMAETPPAQTLSRGKSPAEETRPMTMKMLAFAASLGFAARDEAEAESHITALATEAADVRRALGAKTSAETAAKLSELSAAAAKVPALEAELATAQKAEEARVEQARTAHLEALMLARPELKATRATFEFHAKSNFAEFAALYPLPAGDARTVHLEAELKRTQELARGNRVAPAAGTPNAPESVPSIPEPRQRIALTKDLAAKLREKDPSLSERDALKLASKQLETPSNGARSAARS